MKVKFSFLILSITLIFSSCKKEMGCIDPGAYNYNPDAQVDDGSCIPTVLGCLESNAINYNSDANVSDESCLYAFNIAQGVWNITPDCDEIEIPLIGTISLNDQLPETIEVFGQEDSTLYIEIDDISINGQVDNSGNVTVQEQTISLDFGMGFPTDVEVEGNGVIYFDNTGNINLTYSFEIPIIGTQSIDCSIEMNK
ncbi:MAG: hypothetical protein CMD02_01640 [Flavobacteriales bacterium]|nr:hypothetical protein [Flavobacteriales bacterium]